MLDLCLVAAFTLSSTEPEPAPGPLKVMSFNIRYGTARDGENAWLHRHDQVVARIQAFDPDVLGLQEALAFQVNFLRQALPGYEVLGEGREGGARGEYSCLFVRSARFEVLEHAQFWLAAKPEEVAAVGWDAALPRICTWAALRDRESDGRFTAWNTHFDHRGAKARHESAKLIAARIAAAKGPHVLMGDLNAGEDSAPLRALKEGGLADSYRATHPDSKSAGTFHGFRGGREGGKIDYVLVDSGWSVIDADILSEPIEGRHPSDHHAVVATLAWPAKPDRRDSGDNDGDDGDGAAKNATAR